MAVVSSISALLTALRDPGEGTCVWLDPTYGLVVGAYPTPAQRFDFEAERLVSIGPEAKRSRGGGSGPRAAAPSEKRRIDLSHRARRRSQPYELELDDAIYRFGSAVQLLTEGLDLLEARRPGVLEALSRVKKRTKRPVARRREDLYDSAHPPEHSARLSSGYFVATNNKADEVLRIMRRALLESGAAENPDRQVRRG